MNFTKLTTNNTAEAINARKESLEALEAALKRKILELREVCLKEGELTGQLPVEYPLQPREPLPQISRRVKMVHPSKEPPRRTASNTSSISSSAVSSITVSSSATHPKHYSSHAIKLKHCPSSPLGEHNKISKLEDIHKQIIQIQSAYDPSRAMLANENFGLPRSEQEGLASTKTRPKGIPIKNHSESSIDHEKLKSKHKQAPSFKNREAARETHSRMQPRADVSSISFETMIQPTNDAPAISSHHDNGLSKPISSQNLEQSIRLANLHKEILKLQASQSNHGLPNENETKKNTLNHSKMLGSLNDINSKKDQLSSIRHQRVVSDGCRQPSQHIQSNQFVSPIVQSNDYKVSKPRPKSPSPNFNITEIPAESDRTKSPSAPFSESTADENVNPLTSKISQLSITGVGNFQPYWEETKPYELSDFYKYSAKHRTGNNMKNRNIKEKIMNLQETITDKSNAHQHDKSVVINNKKPLDIGDNNNQSAAIDNNRTVQNTHFNTNSNSSSTYSSTSSNYYRHNVNKQRSTSTNRSFTTSRYA